MKKRHTLTTALCGIVFMASYKLAVWHGFSGQPHIAEECTTPYGGIVSVKLSGENVPG
jgi:hypothetical protein